MRTIGLALALFAATACGNNPKGPGGDDDQTPDACVGLECNVVDCTKMSLPPTAITGTVFAPNGTLPLNGVNVYIPRDETMIGPFTEGVSCDRCSTDLPGGPVRATLSDANGNFRLENVPTGSNIPLVITTGKWRRIVHIATVNQCTDNAVGGADTRLPRNKSEGDIPKIALTTGAADSLECLVKKLGIDLAEITNGGGAGRIHYYAGNGVSSFSAGGNMTSAKDLWDSLDTLKRYDIVFLSCEGGQINQNNATPKSQGSMDNIENYANIGGRVFASHWHNVFIGGNFQDRNPPNIAPAAWTNLATWSAQEGTPSNPILIDERSNPKGTLFADWMVNVGGSTTRGEIPLVSMTERKTARTLDTSRAERWVRAPDDAPQMFQFTTPVDVTPDMRCGKTVFTDMHVSGTSNPQESFPTSCGNGSDLTPQEKALAFMFFDISSCVGGLF